MESIRWTRLTIVAVAFAVFYGFAEAAVPVTEPSIAIGTAGLSVSGITPGASAILLSVSRERRGYMNGYARRDTFLAAADVNGSTHVDLISIPPASIWCVIDPVTGRYSVAGPSEHDLRRLPVPAHFLLPVDGPLLKRLHAKHAFLEVLWVRAGVGAWRVSVGDGGASDADGIVNGHISIAPEAMTPLGLSPSPPPNFLQSDTVVAIDPETMEFFGLEAGQ